MKFLRTLFSIEHVWTTASIYTETSQLICTGFIILHGLSSYSQVLLSPNEELCWKISQFFSDDFFYRALVEGWFYDLEETMVRDTD